jgi:hypothetical protein
MSRLLAAISRWLARDEMRRAILSERESCAGIADGLAEKEQRLADSIHDIPCCAGAAREIAAKIRERK